MLWSDLRTMSEDGPADVCDLGKKSHWDAEFTQALQAYKETGDAG